MAAGSTYTPIATVTLSTPSSVTFSSLGSYTDLVLVGGSITGTSGNTLYMSFNGDTGTNYSETILVGSGTAAASDRFSNSRAIAIGAWYGISSSIPQTVITNIQNYSNSTTNKTTLSRWSSSGTSTEAIVGLWRSTAAITSLSLYIGTASSSTPTGNISVGSTFTLYGIQAA